MKYRKQCDRSFAGHRAETRQAPTEVPLHLGQVRTAATVLVGREPELRDRFDVSMEPALGRVRVVFHVPPSWRGLCGYQRE